MKWFFNWLRNGIEALDKEAREEERPWTDKYRTGPSAMVPKNLKISLPKSKQLAAARDDTVSLNASAMHFRIYPATGGYIVEYQYYDEKNDRHHQALHLIPSELDMGTELSKILTLEALKR
jgi:hypothetical protein